MKRSFSMFWSPWHGCHKCSPGCANCYVYYLDKCHDKDASIITRSKTAFNLPLKKTRSGEYKIPAGSEVATCFTSDFFLPEADEWRKEAWKMIKIRSDVTFLICTKRIERFEKCIPSDWGEGYPNVKIAVTCECQQKVDERLPILLNIKAKTKYVFVSPILECVKLDKYLALGQIDMVSVGGESYQNARECDFDWVKDLYLQCRQHDVEFDFHQTGSNFKMLGKRYKISHNKEFAQAKKGMVYLEKTFK